MQKLALKAGNWMGSGHKLARWAKKGSIPGVIAGANLIGSLVGGAALTAGIPITTVVATSAKMAIRREAKIEAHKTQARDIGLTEVAHKRDLAYEANMSALTGNEAIVERSLKLLTGKGIELSEGRRQEVRKELVIGFGISAISAVGGYGAGKLISMGAETIGSLNVGSDSLSNVDIATIPTEVADPITVDTDTELVGTPTVTVTPETTPTPDAAEPTVTPSHEADEGVVDLTGDDEASTASQETTDASATTETEADEDAMSEKPAEPVTSEVTPEAPMGTVMEALTAETTVNSGDGVTHVLKSVLESVGVESVPPEQLYGVYLGLVNDPEIGPNNIFNGATLEYNAATGEYWIMGEPPFEASFTPEAAEWMVENAPELYGIDASTLESSLSIEMAGGEQAIADVSETSLAESATDGTDGASVDSAEEQSSAKVASRHSSETGVADERLGAHPPIESIGDSDGGLSGAESESLYEPDVSEQPPIEQIDDVTTDSGNQIVEPTGGVDSSEFTYTTPPSFEELGKEFVFNPGDSPGEVFKGIFKELGYNPTPSQLHYVYTEAIQELGADGIFVDTELVLNSSTRHYELPAGSDSARFTPEAAQWLQKRFDWGGFGVAPQ